MLPKKDLFELPGSLVYLDGNSLGVLPRGAAERAAHVITREWGHDLIRAWNEAGWIDLPRVVGNKLARLLGAAEGSIATGDTLSIKVYQALASALKLQPDRRVVLSDTGNFPSDLYMAQGLIQTLDAGHILRTVEPDQVLKAITDEVAVVMLTHVDYRTGRLHDMEAITQRAQAAGALVIWDLAHSAGAVPVDLTASNTEFAVGCTYKYLNGGPGSPAFIYVRPDLVEQVEPALAGWMGHEAPFAMDLAYAPAMSTERMRVGTPPIVQLSILDHALNIWEDIEMAEIRAASIRLSELFIREVERKCPGLTLASPRDPQQRGSQVSFVFEHGYAAMQALIDRGVIGDFRAPNLMRFGFTPLYLDEAQIRQAASTLQDVLDNRFWDNPKYRKPSRVT